MTALATATGRHRRPTLPRRVLHAARLAVLRVLADVADWRLRRRREDVDLAGMLAWLSRARVKNKISPVAEAQIATHVAVQVAASVQAMQEHHEEPVPADAFNVLPVALWPDDDDPRYAHLRGGQYGDWGTGQFQKIAQEWTA